jgi:hypothetical protein
VRGIALQGIASAEQGQHDVVTDALKMTSGDEAIAAVVARSAEDDDLAAGGRHTGCLRGDGAAGVLHQREARDACFNGQFVGLAHFSCRQQLEGEVHSGFPFRSIADQGTSTIEPATSRASTSRCALAASFSA